jgi:hypothetical protein
MKDIAIQDHNQTINVIQSGLMGSGDWISVVSEVGIRFTKAIALGNGKFPDYDVILEENLNTFTSKGYFVIEVPTNDYPTQLQAERLLEDVVNGGYYIQAFNKAKEVGLFTGLITSFENYPFVSLEVNWGNTHIEVNGTLTSDGHLMFTKTLTETNGEHKEITVVCDGFVYPYDTRVKFLNNGSISLSKGIVREMTEKEWDYVKSQPHGVKFIYQSM